MGGDTPKLAQTDSENDLIAKVEKGDPLAIVDTHRKTNKQLKSAIKVPHIENGDTNLLAKTIKAMT